MTCYAYYVFNQFCAFQFLGAGSSKIFVFHFQDIYEGTEFHPVSSVEHCLTKENYYSLFVRLSVSQIVTTVTSRRVLQFVVFSGPSIISITNLVNRACCYVLQKTVSKVIYSKRLTNPVIMYIAA